MSTEVGQDYRRLSFCILRFIYIFQAPTPYPGYQWMGGGRNMKSVRQLDTRLLHDLSLADAVLFTGRFSI